MKRKNKKILIISLFISLFAQVYSQDADINKYKAMFSISMIRFVGWTDANKEGDFVIGVLKQKEVMYHFQSNSINKKVGFQTIVVKYFENLEALTECQILYISNNVSLNNTKNIDVIKSKIKNPTLIVTETVSANPLSMINFVIVDDKLKFEVYTNSIEKGGLKVSNSLTSLSNAIVK